MTAIEDVITGVRAHPVFLAFPLVVIPIVYSLFRTDKRLKHLPPGPKGYPFIGNMLDFADTEKVPEIAEDWAREYGKICYTKIGATHFIWLNTAGAVKDLMDKRSSKYSGRPHMPMAYDATSGRARQFFMPYGERWRNVRKVSHAALNIKTSDSYRPIQDFESKQVLYDFLHNPDDFYDANRRYSASVILTVTYGHRVASWEDPVVKKVYSVLDHFVQMAVPGKWLVDAFPSLAALPSFLVQNWWKIGREWFEYDSKVYLDLYRGMIEREEAGKGVDCFARDFYLGNPSKNGIDELTAAYSCGTLVEAGSESTSTVINNWLLALLLYPKAMRDAQEEIDRVCGEKMPSFDDIDNMPYLQAMVKETLRWRPITKFGVNHSTTEDDWYEGYFIPKDSVIMGNWWGIHFNPERWGQKYDVHDFEPMRYMGDPAGQYSTAECLNVANPDDRDHLTYGAGRRVCSGVHLAQNSLHINMARVMWAFNVVKKKGPDGKPMEPPTETKSGFLSIPVKFPCAFEPRNPWVPRVIDETWQRAQDDGLDWTRAKRTI